MKIRKVGVVLRPKTEGIDKTFQEIKKIFEDFDIEVLLEKKSASEVKETQSLELKELICRVDAMVSIGGDGTLLSLIRNLYGSMIPVFGINIGNLGFLTSTNPQEIHSFISRLRSGEYVLESHMILEANLQSRRFFAINEFLIAQSGSHSGILEIQALIKGKTFNTYRSDALIIATPTGSTAYNISAGGSIVYPLCRNILLTPVAAHTLTQRPMVLNDSFVLEFRIKKSAVLVIDGQDKVPFEPRDTLMIKVAKESAILIQDKNRDYFQVLREKFQWGQK